MNSTTELWIQALTQHKKQLKSLDKAMATALKSKSPRAIRSHRIAVLRMVHLIKLVRKAFWAARPPKNAAMSMPRSVQDVLTHRNSALLLTVYYFTRVNRIPMEHWFRAQFDTLTKMKNIWANCFYGHNAFLRYADWDHRLSRKYTATQDRNANAIPASLKDKISKAIMSGHKHAMTFHRVFQEIQPPTRSAALAYISSYVPVWYLLAYEDFVQDVVASGILSYKLLDSAYAQYLKSPWIRKHCHDALATAELHYGTLEHA